MEADATNAKLKFDTAAQPTAELARNIERCAGEYMLKARIVVSGIADESRYRQAVKLMSTAIDLVSGRLPEETLAEYLFDYAVLLTDAGQQTKALETWERLSGIYERLYRKAPQKYAYGYAGVLNNMAVLYSNKGDFDHCLSKYLKAVDIYDRLDREEPGIYDDDIARLKITSEHFTPTGTNITKPYRSSTRLHAYGSSSSPKTTIPIPDRLWPTFIAIWPRHCNFRTTPKKLCDT